MRQQPHPLARLRQELKARFAALRSRDWWERHWTIFMPWMLVGVALLIGGAVFAVNASFRDEVMRIWRALSSGNRNRVRDVFARYGAWTPWLIYAVMTLQVLVVGVPASILMFVNGMLFGPVWGSLLNLAGRTSAGAVGFGVARWMGKGAVERLVGTIADEALFAAWMRRWGGWAMFSTRAVPGMPSDICSYVGGFTTMRWSTFLWSTVLGFVPQCAVYAWLGDRAMGSFWWVFIGGFGLMAVAAGFIWLVNRVGRVSSDGSS